MKKYSYFVLFVVLLTNCTQKPAEVVQKSQGVYNPTYTEVYVESPDGKIARSLRGHTDGSKAQEVSIINKNAVNEKSDSQDNIYVVKSGDSLWSISRKYNMLVPELVALNNLKKPYNIRPGQKLKVSNVENKNVVKIKKIDTYIVKSGDNLSTIASKFDMKTNELAELNNLEKPYKIMVGQKLKINKNATLAAQNTPEQKIQQKSKSDVKPVVSNANKKNSFVWPVKGEVISSFGNKSNGLYNDGINISASKGTDFKATEDGVVAYVGNELRGYGTIILIKHNNNWISAYAHCGSVKVSRGDRVQRGQVIGTVGQTGSVSSPQLYFSLRSGREAVDPIKYLE